MSPFWLADNTCTRYKEFFMYVSVNDDSHIDVFAEEQDMCSSCLHASDCPLVSALQMEIVILRYEGMTIENCELSTEA